MKTTKLLLVGVLLSLVTSLNCYADTSTDELLNMISSLSSSSSSSSTSLSSSGSNLLSLVASYMDKNLLSAYYAAFAADQLTTKSTPEGFFLEYCSQHSDFQANYLAAVEKAKKALGIGANEDLSTAIEKIMDDLKKAIEDNKNLSDDEKKKYQDLLDKYADQLKQLNQNLANTQNAASQAIQALAQAKAQQPDPMQQMMPMLMMMMMMMMGGGGGGGGCGGGGGGGCQPGGG